MSQTCFQRHLLASTLTLESVIQQPQFYKGCAFVFNYVYYGFLRGYMHVSVGAQSPEETRVKGRELLATQCVC